MWEIYRKQGVPGVASQLPSSHTHPANTPESNLAASAQIGPGPDLRPSLLSPAPPPPATPTAT